MAEIISTAPPSEVASLPDSEEGPMTETTALLSRSIATCAGPSRIDASIHGAQRPRPSSTGTAHKESSNKFRLSERVSLTLQNSGSVARDHLASERTFLAYIRTSLAIATAGVALVQLLSVSKLSSDGDSLLRYIRFLGAGVVILGIIVLIIGVTRYFTIQVALVKGYFPVARLATASITFMLAAVITLIFGMLFAEDLRK